MFSRGLSAGRLAGAMASAMLAGLSGGAAFGEGYEFLASSFVGGTGDEDAVNGARIQSDGTIVLAATIAPDAKLGPRPGGDPRKPGAVIRVSPDGRKILSVVRLADELKDMDIDDKDCIYLAAGAAGIVKLDPDARKVLWQKAVGGDCSRVAAGRDGHSIALAGDTGTVFDPSGKELAKVKSGRQFTEDCCIDSESKTAVLIGFRNANAFDGNRTYPVQICCLFGHDYSGERKWSAYDWSTDRDSDRFLNKSENNMADTRGYRCSIGRDGKLYAAFEAAGGNHCFRYSSVDITRKVSMAGGDAHHSFHNSRAEHKTVFVRMEPGTGEYLAGQQFCARLPNGRANATRVKTGEITADEHGRVCLTGASAYGLPMTFQPPGVGEYKGGAYVLVMSPGLKTRLLCTRLQAGGGEPQAVSGRVVDGRAVVAFAGGGLKVGEDGRPEPFYLLEPVQAETVGRDGYFAVAAMPGAGVVPQELLVAPRRSATAERDAGQRTSPRAAPQSRLPDAEEVEKWDARLRRRIAEALASGAKISMHSRDLGGRCLVTGIADDGAVRMRTPQVEMVRRWALLTYEERRDLALKTVRPNEPADEALSAFYLFATGDPNAAEGHLRQAGALAEEVRAAFGD